MSGLLRRHLLDVTPLRTSQPFRRLVLGDAISMIGVQVTAVAVPLQVYAQTRSAAAVGLVGLVGLVPLVVLGLYGGAVADAVDRRRLVLTTTTVQACLSSALAVQALAGLHWTWLLYVIVAVQAGLFAIESPARGAIIPRLVPKQQLPQANALRMTEFNLGLFAGPLVAGVLVSVSGFGTAYLLDAVSFGASFWAISLLPPMAPEGGGTRAGFASVVEGLRFLGTRQVLYMTFVVDIIAMVFGMPRALFPSMADKVFHGGPTQAGAMFSAMALGALVGAAFGGWFGRVHRQGLAVLLSVVAFGACIVGYGLTSHLWLALVLLAGAGATDMVSAVFRSAILQTAAPDAMRGRLGGVFIVVVSGGPRLGDGRSGGMASLVGIQQSIVVGGVLVIGLTVLAGLLVPRFAAYDTRHSVAEVPEPTA